MGEYNLFRVITVENKAKALKHVFWDQGALLSDVLVTYDPNCALKGIDAN